MKRSELADWKDTILFPVKRKYLIYRVTRKYFLFHRGISTSKYVNNKERSIKLKIVPALYTLFDIRLSELKGTCSRYKFLSGISKAVKFMALNTNPNISLRKFSCPHIILGFSHKF
jgi:hypothetical protein